MPVYDAGCGFCGQLVGDATRNDLAPLLLTAWANRPVLMESPHVVVMPSIGALAPGHVLVCPRDHIRSAALASAEARSELTTAASLICDRLTGATGQPVHIFEHGSSATGARVACSIEHAHIHLVPAAVDIGPRLDRVAEWRQYDGGLDELMRATGGLEYLFYRAPTGEAWVATTLTGFPSQALRQIFAVELGAASKWDWRRYPAIENITATISMFIGRDAVRADLAATC